MQQIHAILAAMTIAGVLSFVAISAEAQAVSPTATVADRRFAQQVAMNDLFEIEASRLAMQRARQGPIRDLAQAVSTDHLQSSQELKAWGDKSGIALTMPTRLDAPHARMLAQLRAASDRGFDELYLIMQAEMQKRASQLRRDYLDGTGAPALKTVAEAGEVTVQQHLARIKEIAAAAQR